MNIENYAEELYDRVKARFPIDGLNKANIFELIRLSMEEVDKFSELAGRQKKELVIRIAHEALKDAVLDDADNLALNLLVDNFVDIIIDNFCDIDLGNLGINEDQKHKIRAFFKKCLPCCVSSAPAPAPAPAPALSPSTAPAEPSKQ